MYSESVPLMALEGIRKFRNSSVSSCCDPLLTILLLLLWCLFVSRLFTPVQSWVEGLGWLNMNPLEKVQKMFKDVKTIQNKTGVINDPLSQTHISCFRFVLFCEILKVGTDGRHVQKQWSLPWPAEWIKTDI